MNVMFPYQKFQECKKDSHLHSVTHVFNAGTSFSLMRNLSSGKCYHRNPHSVDKGKSLSLSLQLNKAWESYLYVESGLVQLQVKDILRTRRDTALPEGSSGSPRGAQILRTSLNQAKQLPLAGFPQPNVADSFQQARWGTLPYLHGN